MVSRNPSSRHLVLQEHDKHILRGVREGLSSDESMQSLPVDLAE